MNKKVKCIDLGLMDYKQAWDYQQSLFDEIVDVKNLNMKTTVNGKIMQNGNTKDMIHSINHVIAYLSTFIKLQRGDLIIFGTPDGVGAGIKPNPVFLKDGDMIELEIEGLGKQKHKVINQN